MKTAAAITVPEDERLEVLRRRLLYGCLLLALAIRLPALHGGLWFDEIWTLVDFGRLPLGELLTTYGSDNNHPLYSILARVSILIFGEQAWSLRLPALIFGLLSIVELHRLGRLLLGPRRALLAAFILAIAGPHVWFSTNARGYTALLYFSLLATRQLLLMREDRGRGPLIKQALALALGSYVHATMVFVALAQFVGGALVLRGRRRRRALGAVLLAGAVSLALHAPILGEMSDFLLGGEGHAKMSSVWNSPLWMLREAAARFGLPFPVAVIAGLSGLVLGGIGLRRLARIDVMLPVMILGPALLGAVTMIALGRHLWPRFFFFEIGFALLLVVMPLGERPTGSRFGLRRSVDRLLILVLVTLALLSLLRSQPLRPKQDFAGAATHADELPAGRVATVGLARMPYADYIVRPYRAIEKRAELEAMLAEGEVFVIDTLPIFLETRQPEIARLVRERGVVEMRFPGSLGGGDVVIWRLR